MARPVGMARGGGIPFHCTQYYTYNIRNIGVNLNPMPEHYAPLPGFLSPHPRPLDRNSGSSTPPAWLALSE